MTHPRRKFLKSATQLGCGLVLTSISQNIIGCKATSKIGNTTKPFGLQLYTLRDELPKDPKGVLKQVASFGYKQIEGFEGRQGMFWGMSHTEFKKYMDDLGMNFVSSHCDINKDFEQKADQAAAIGMKYLIAPYLGKQKSMDDYKRAAERFNDRAAICKKAGIRFAYHNHDYSFVPVDGVFPQDIMMQNTDKDMMDYEMDIYWVVTAGQDPVAWFKKYPNRFKLCHVKDRRKGAPITDHDASVVAGTGSIDYPTILKAAEKEGMAYYIIEQEHYDNMTQVQAAKLNADYMKQLRF